MKEAGYYSRIEENKVECHLCPHNCIIKSGNSGICGARKNFDGILNSLNYGVISSMSLDPIEKKPLYHFYPGSQILSIGTVGCNLHCLFCQNYNISRYFDESDLIPMENYKPSDILDELKKRNRNSPGTFFSGVAYTYSEPLVWIEFVYETSRLLKENGYQNVLVTNGYVNPEPLKDLLPYISAANIDLKAFTEENYKKLGGKLKPVLDTITAFKNAGVHIELTTLVVTKFNDNPDELESLVKWIAGLDKKIPLHLSRYFPQYKYKEPPTDSKLLENIRKMAESYLSYVYLGNTGSDSDTLCPTCRSTLVERQGYHTRIKGIMDKKCRECGNKTDIIQ